MPITHTLAQTLGSELALVRTITELGAFALVTFLVIWFVIKIHPKHQEAITKLCENFITRLDLERATHDTERRTDREHFVEERKRDRTEIAGTIERNTVATRELSATFKGVCAYASHVPQHHNQPHPDGGRTQ